MKFRGRLIVCVAGSIALFTGCSGLSSQSEFLNNVSAHSSGSARGSLRRPVSENVLWEFRSSGPYIPVASLVADASGALYGTLEQGGLKTGFCYNIGGCGGVFKLVQSGSRWNATILYSFTGGSDGAGPIGNLYIDSSGTIYGTTVYAGSTSCGESLGCGTVFKLVPSGSTYTERTVYIFQGGKDGSGPAAGLIPSQHANGALYGTTQAGGNSVGSFAGNGTVFEVTKKGREIVLHRFRGCSKSSKHCDGSNPFAPLYMDSSGNLFGTTAYGGAYQCPLGNLCGTAFELKHVSKNRYKERVIYNFKGNTDGANSFGGLIADAQGALYGTTSLGGGGTKSDCYFGSVDRGCGTVFKLAPAGKGYQEAVLYAFQGGLDGAGPGGGVVMDSSGSLYGTTAAGGYCGSCGGYGTVFGVTPAGSQYTESMLYAFHCSSSGCTGQAPVAGLIEINGTLYGTTSRSFDGTGEVFSLAP